VWPGDDGLAFLTVEFLPPTQQALVVGEFLFLGGAAALLYGELLLSVLPFEAPLHDITVERHDDVQQPSNEFVLVECGHA